MNPTQTLTWENFETRLVAMLKLPHNLRELKQRGDSPEQAAKKIKETVRGAFLGDPKVHEFVGPVRFFRGVGPKKDPLDPFRDNAYGNWWFEELVVRRLEQQYARIFFNDEERRRAMSDTIRAGLAIAYDWTDELSEYWMLELPPGERLTGFVGPAKPQPTRSGASAVFPGGLMQIYFPVKNPLLIRRYV